MATYPLVKSRVEVRPGWRDYLALCKLRVVAVMLLTLIVGMCLATPELPPLGLLLVTNLGVGLAAASAAAVNHVLDQSIDARMARTARRPLPQGRISQLQAVIFAACIGVVGIALLAVLVNPLTAWLTLASLIGYAFVYTAFLKRATPQNIVIGGVAGAAPPLLGWVAVTGQVTADGLLLMLIIFAWTPPHFWALCIARKDDYARAGIPMLPNTHGERFTRLQILLYTVLTVLLTLLPWFVGLSGVIYLVGVLILDMRFLQWAWRLYRCRDAADPMRMFRFSILYIMGLFAILLVDHYWLTSL
ncbi:protoheme IX farnesyltransferase 1 [Marinobacterium zhoushanense]|uniref:Protoheme IX farnesyltransferase n=1 Tax=Marinobacterium zhoushanense TaxID=1679163 RepID=A0ABQ1KY69_9GAMM|nr:heme o synthase [Marinobacterium zhoushanense]GGC11373.1 protoheme IX farnesyltransferase 1 [Marinobacterium zhoushanense]